MPPFLVYTVSRAAVFVVTAALLYVLGARGWLLLLLAVLISGLLSWRLLAGQREAVARQIEGRVERSRQAIEERTAAEDAYDDEQRRGSAEG